MAQTFILRENVLTDNTLTIPENGNVFKGNYIAIIKENVFLSAWCDKETVKKFRKQKSLDNYLSKKYPEFCY